jgi:predicted nucleic acid-binding protein
MTAFVLDVSVTMAWCFEDESSDETWQLLDRLANDSVLVPGIWSAEVANVLLVAERRRRLTRPQARAFIARL